MCDNNSDFLLVLIVAICLSSFIGGVTSAALDDWRKRKRK